jgi:hypothetical protein
MCRTRKRRRLLSLWGNLPKIRGLLTMADSSDKRVFFRFAAFKFAGKMGWQDFAQVF